MLFYLRTNTIKKTTGSWITMIFHLIVKTISHTHQRFVICRINRAVVNLVWIIDQIIQSFHLLSPDYLLLREESANRDQSQFPGSPGYSGFQYALVNVVLHHFDVLRAYLFCISHVVARQTRNPPISTGAFAESGVQFHSLGRVI